jgi:CelD/BcsL family acetyltransferase involved in cellulose biosynthesis
MNRARDIQVLRTLDSIIWEWHELFALCRDATPFQSPEWLLPWWSCFGMGDPLVIAVRQRNQLCGLGLFYFYSGDPSKGTQLFLLGKSVSDYLDILVADDEHRPQIAQQIFDSIFEQRDAWKYADLDRLRSSSAVLQVQPGDNISTWQMQDGVCPELPLPGSTIKQIVKKSTRDAMRKHLNRARGLGNVEFVTADQESYFSFMNDLVRLHSVRWHSSGLPGVFADPKMVRFLTDAGWQLLQGGTLRLHAMLLNGKPVAISFGMLYREREYFYLCDFDPAHVSISPGTLVSAFAIEQAAQHGAKFFDFLQGDEPHKFQKWGARPRFTYRVRYSHQRTPRNYCLPQGSRILANLESAA